MKRTDLYSNQQKGAVGEYALDTLTLLLTCGDLHLAQPLPDDVRIDRVLFRPGRPSGRSIQIKSPEYLILGRHMSLRVRAPARGSALDGFYILAARHMRRSPWIDGGFYLIPASFLGAPASGWWRLSLPLHPSGRGKYRRFQHPLTELGTVLSQTLDGGRAYPFPPSPARLRRLSTPAVGRLLENELACVVTVLSDGSLRVWRPMVDDFGQDLSVSDEAQAASLRIQVKGCLGPTPRRTVSAHIQQRTFRQSRFNLVAILWYDVPRLRLGESGWVFRTDELADLGLELDAQGSYRFEAPASPTSRNKYRPWLYRVEEIPDVLRTVLALVGKEGAEAAVPTSRDELAKARAQLRLR